MPIFGAVSLSGPCGAPLGRGIALGASGGSIVSLVLGRSLLVAVAGMITDLALSVLGTRVLGQFLNQVSPIDLTALAAVAVLLLVVALVASLAPALRAGRLAPMSTLRLE